MTNLILRRMISGLAAVLLASLLAFLILEASPGDAITNLLGDTSTEEQQNALREELHLDQPVFIRFVDYLGGLVQGDLGVSAVNGRPVADLVGIRFLNTFLLACVAILGAVVIGVSTGIGAAIHYNTRMDLLLLIGTTICLAVPAFAVAILLIQVFSVRLGWLPTMGGGTLRHLVLPCISLAIPTGAVIARIVRARMLEEIRKPYVLTALAKGRSIPQVWWIHVFRNALIPALTVVGVQFGHLLGGAFIVETIFAWPGLGRLTVQAIFDRDYPVVLGAVVLSACIFQACNFLVDISHARLDPRIREKCE